MMIFGNINLFKCAFKNKVIGPWNQSWKEHVRKGHWNQGQEGQVDALWLLSLS